MCSTPATSRTCSTWATTSSSVAEGAAWSSRYVATNASSASDPGSTPAATAAAEASAYQSRTCSFTNFGTNVTMQTPPLPASRASTSSGTLRGWSQTALAEECENTTGTLETSSACLITSALTWLRSTSIPI